VLQNYGSVDVRQYLPEAGVRPVSVKLY
jgi:hypothetical protein